MFAVLAVLAVFTIAIVALVMAGRTQAVAADQRALGRFEGMALAASHREPRKPDMGYAAEGFMEVMLLKRSRPGSDLEKYAAGRGNQMLDAGCTFYQALSAQWGGILAIHTDETAWDDAKAAYNDTVRALGRGPAGSERLEPKEKAHFQLKSVAGTLVALQLTLHPDDYERFLQHVGK